MNKVNFKKLPTLIAYMEQTTVWKGGKFERIAMEVISHVKQKKLRKNVPIPIGIGKIVKAHKFDLGNVDEKILVECKFHGWTKSGNSPSAKMTIWNEAMFYFSLVPSDYTNILFVKKSVHIKKGKTLAEHYVDTYSHLIPENVEIWEYDEESKGFEIFKN